MKKDANKIIYVSIYCHGSATGELVTFEESDLRVVSIGYSECLCKKDFDRLWESINEIDGKGLEPENVYLFGFIRNVEYDRDRPAQDWFELVEKSIVEIKHKQ